MTAVDPSPASGQAGPKSRGDLALRLWSSAVLIPIAALGAWWGGWPAYCLAAAVAALVHAEWTVVIGRTGSLLPASAEAAAGLVFVVLATLTAGLAGAMPGVMVALAGVLGVALLSRSAWSAAGALYAGLFGVSLAAIRSDPEFGLEAIVVLLVLVWATDSCAYFAGRKFGGAKLWPRISPNKTWSGSIGGLLGGVLAAAIVAALVGVSVGAGLVIVLALLSASSQLGDLFESAVKRRFKRKDASSIIPGHGGMMDRVDGLLFAGVAALFIGWLHAGAAAIGRGVLLW
jgi:phosphatidate cytidylyltransferase